MAVKIQSAFRNYLKKKQASVLKKIVVTQVVKLQRAWRRHKVLKGLRWRRRVKMLLNSVVTAWRTRQALNCLSKEI